MSENDSSSRLYRIENPAIPVDPSRLGEVSHPGIIGQWFSPDLDTALNYLPKSTQTYGKNPGVVAGTQLVIAIVPTEKLDAYHVDSHPIAAALDHEPNNYLIPRDGSVPMVTLHLDDVLGDLKGNLGNFHKRKEAEERVRDTLGDISLK
jgi:hypothetical protein